MKCNEIRDLLFETEELKSLELNEDFVVHLRACPQCRAKLAFEKKIRHGFTTIAQQEPPPQLAELILQIPDISKTENSNKKQINKEEKSLFAYWLRKISSLPVKTAFASALAGFLLAIVLIKSEPRITETRLSMSKQADKAMCLKTSVETENPEISKQINRMPGKPDELAEPQLPDLKEKATMPLISKEIVAEKAVEANPEESEQIPGAISFSIAAGDTIERRTNKELLKPETSDSAAQVGANAAGQRRKRQKFQLVKSSRAPEPMPAEQIESCFALDDSFVESRPAVSKPLIENDSPKITIDSRCKELEKIIFAYSYEIEPGKLDLENLAARGLIPTDKLDYFAPPPGSAWFYEIDDGVGRVSLKKE
ncbi:MAG: hypothetical protein Kow0029_19580 [Candidatus Rifleibacteriota bacterium]